MKEIPNSLTNKELEYLAKGTDKFSCLDIEILTQDSIFEPVRKCQYPEFFKKMPGVNGQEWNYIPCDQNEPDAIKMKMSEISDVKQLFLPKVVLGDFLRKIRKNWGHIHNE